VEYKTFMPGQPRFHPVTVQLPQACRSGANLWFEDVIDGHNPRKDVTISIADWKTGADAVTAQLYDTLPMSFDPSSGLITLHPERIGVAAVALPNAPYSAKPTHAYRIYNGNLDETGSASLVNGGFISLEPVSATAGSDEFQTTTLSLKWITPLYARLHSPMQSAVSWINALVAGGDYLRSVDVSSSGLSTTYLEAFPIKFVLINPLTPLSSGLMPAIFDVTFQANQLQR
jgi:hypothetical protein